MKDRNRDLHRTVRAAFITGRLAPCRYNERKRCSKLPGVSVSK